MCLAFWDPRSGRGEAMVDLGRDVRVPKLHWVCRAEPTPNTVKKVPYGMTPPLLPQ